MNQHSSKPVLLCAVGILVAFFMPWVQLFGVGMSGYNLGNLGSYGNYAWIIPILAGGTILLSFLGVNNRGTGALTGIVPLGALAYALIRLSSEGGADVTKGVLNIALQIFSIGIYLTIIFSVAIIISAASSSSSTVATKELLGSSKSETSVPRKVFEPIFAIRDSETQIKTHVAGSMLGLSGNEIESLRDTNKLAEREPPGSRQQPAENEINGPEQARAQKRGLTFGIAVAVVMLLVGFAWWFEFSRQFNQALTRGKPMAIEGESAYELNQKASMEQTALVPSDVRAVLEQWRQSMLSGDVDAQTNCYAPTVELFFRRKNLDREILRKMKRSGMDAYSEVRAYRLTDVELQSLSESRAVVTFRKYWDAYGTKHFSGEEKQRLTFLKVEAEWKIVREEELQIYWVKKG